MATVMALVGGHRHCKARRGGQNSRSGLILSSFGIIRCWDQLSRAMTSSARGIGKTVHSSEQAAFCALMVAARKQAGLTQHELARRLKRPQSFVAKYEGGERRIDVVEFVTIVRAIGADPVKLLRDLIANKPPAKPYRAASR